MRLKVILAFTILILLLIGCAPDSRELDHRSMIMGLAIDQGEESLYKITIQLPILGDGGGVAPHGRDFETFSVETDNLWDGIIELESYTPTVLFFGHLKVIALSELVAKNDLKEVLDLLDRNAAMANQLYLVVTEGIEAGEFIKKESPLVRLPALYLDRFFRAGQRIGRVEEMLLFEFLRDSNMISKASSLPLATLKGKAVVVEGSGIFQDYQLVGKLKKTKAAINQLLKKDEIQTMNYTVVVDGGEDNVTVSLSRMRLRQKVAFSQTKPIQFQLDINGLAVIEEISDVNYRDSTEFIRKVEEKANIEIAKEIHETIREMKNINVEPWLYGHRVWALNPTYFDTLNWEEEGWREAKFSVNVDLKINSTGQRGYHYKRKIGR